MFERLRDFCNSFLDLGVPGFDLAVYKDGECVLRHMNGYSDLEHKTPMTGRERYNIYSCSKVITCTAALQLWERGLFSLEDELSRYMPEFKEMTVRTENGIQKAKNPILVKHLFEMTAGFSYDTSSPQLLNCRKETGDACPTRETMKYLAKEPLLFEPGTRWEYSLCHDVLAALVEVISDMKFEDYVHENIFRILGMEQTTFMLPEEEIDTISKQYRFEGGKPINVGQHISVHKIGSEYAAGGAGCISTVDDYIKFLEGVRKFVLLRPQTVELLRTDRLSEQQKGTYSLQATHGYGLGVRCQKTGGKFTEFGWSGAAGAYLSVDIENGISIYLGTHIIGSPVLGLCRLLYRFVYAELFDQNEFEAIFRDLKELYNYNLTYYENEK